MWIHSFGLLLERTTSLQKTMKLASHLRTSWLFATLTSQQSMDKVSSIHQRFDWSSGFIGKKGIGFKSVFKVSDTPHIFSGDFSFKFDTQSEELSYIMPVWVEREEILKVHFLSLVFSPFWPCPSLVLLWLTTPTSGFLYEKTTILMPRNFIMGLTCCFSFSTSWKLFQYKFSRMALSLSKGYDAFSFWNQLPRSL